MKLCLDKEFIDLKGTPLEANMSEALANQLAMSTIGIPAKMMSWALKLIETGEIEIDKSDKKFLSDFIEKSPGLANLAKAQLLEEIDKLKE